jgi:hypothetical protein
MTMSQLQAHPGTIEQVARPLPGESDIACALEAMGEDATVERINETRSQIGALRASAYDEQHAELTEEIEAAQLFDEESSVASTVDLNKPASMIHALLSAYSDIDELLDNVISAMPEGLTSDERRTQRLSNAMRNAVQEKMTNIVSDVAVSSQAALIGQLARMTPDGENGFVMENDDAVTTLNEFIREARQIHGGSAAPSAQDVESSPIP